MNMTIFVQTIKSNLKLVTIGFHVFSIRFNLQYSIADFGHIQDRSEGKTAIFLSNLVMQSRYVWEYLEDRPPLSKSLVKRVTNHDV